MDKEHIKRLNQKACMRLWLLSVFWKYVRPFREPVEMPPAFAKSLDHLYACVLFREGLNHHMDYLTGYWLKLDTPMDEYDKFYPEG